MKLTINNLLISLWFIVIMLIIFGSSAGRGLEYKFAPYLVFISLIIIKKHNVTLLHNRLLKVMVLFIIITFLSSINWLYFSSSFSYTYFQYLSYSICAYLVALAAYSHIMKCNRMEMNYFKICCLILFIIGIYRFFHTYFLIISLNSSEASNSFYYVLMPLPLLFLLNRRYNFIFLIVNIILCVLSAKRSALIVIFLITILYLYFSYKSFNKWNSILFILSFILIGSYLVKDVDFVERFTRLSDRMYQIQDDGGSGRFDIIEDFFSKDIDYILRFPEILLGNGYNSYSIYHNGFLAAAHNDFLEIFFAFGIIGLISLFIFYIYLYKRFLWSFKTNDKIYAIPCSTALITFMLYSLVANNFYFFFYSLPLFIYIGVSEALYNKIR